MSGVELELLAPIGFASLCGLVAGAVALLVEHVRERRRQWAS